MTDVLAPVSGRIVSLAEVPDPVFARATAGPGAAVEPVREPITAISPVTGKILKLDVHAFVVVDPEGHGVLVHLGIDTVELQGAGFEVLAAEGDQVTAGQALVRWNPADIEAGGRSPVCPVVALDAAREALSGVVTSGRVAAGDPLFTWR